MALSLTLQCEIADLYSQVIASFVVNTARMCALVPTHLEIWFNILILNHILIIFSFYRCVELPF